ncbi:hypothetical protein BJX99DRAFT_227931 [Aspergillus californicus]
MILANISRHPELQVKGNAQTTSMHRVVVPKNSSAHRFACLTLYRALLRQCNKPTETAPQLAVVQSHIRERFRRYRSLQSPSQCANSLKAGYQAFDLLYSASRGSKKDADLIDSIITEANMVKQGKQRLQADRANDQPEPAAQLSARQIKKQENMRFQKASARPHPDKIPILSRPRPVVSGRRRVPHLANARGVPFLRINKPQPKFLSAIIKAKLDRRWKMILRKDKMELETLFANDEDQWDAMTTGEDTGETSSWSVAPRAVWQDTKNRISNVDHKNLAHAEALWNVVLAERKLAEEERQRAGEKQMSDENQRPAAT